MLLCLAQSDLSRRGWCRKSLTGLCRPHRRRCCQVNVGRGGGGGGGGSAEPEHEYDLVFEDAIDFVTDAILGGQMPADFLDGAYCLSNRV